MRHSGLQAFSITDRKGISLVELLVAMVVAAMLGMVIYTFIMFSSKSLRKITAMQMLQQEGTVVSEFFKREIRNGSYITVGAIDTEPPQNDTTPVYEIRVHDPAGSIRASFAIQNNHFIANWHAALTDQRILSEHVWEGADTATAFMVFKHGEHVRFHLNLFRSVGDDTLFLSQMVGDVRCKNWVSN